MRKSPKMMKIILQSTGDNDRRTAKGSSSPMMEHSPFAEIDYLFSRVCGTEKITNFKDEFKKTPT